MANWDSLRGTDWSPPLRREFERPYWLELQAFIEEERSRSRVYPPPDEVFATMRLTPRADTKVVILGQDPYVNAGQAHGLAFSVPQGAPVPPSLKNIHRELHEDLGVLIPRHGSLERWAHQGVLLLNTTLTVAAGKPESHRGKGWEVFTDEVIRVTAAKNDPVVLFLWGKHAKEKQSLIEGWRHMVFASSHPSPLAANSGERPFFGSRPFSRANQALIAAGLQPIDWRLPE
jgi:uracil-DNA glycosylase